MTNGVKPNPNFKRIPRTDTGSKSVVNASNTAISLAEKVKEFKASQEKQKKQDAKEFRQNTVGTLGEVTERFINEGFSEEEAFNEAKNIIDEVDSDPNFQAKGGFMGMINTRSIFTVGEKNKKEFVSVKPKKKMKNQFDNFFREEFGRNVAKDSPLRLHENKGKTESVTGNVLKKHKKSNNIFDFGGF